MRILCFGDSNTYGYDPRSFWGSRYGAEHRWVDLLSGKLDCRALNAGENGREIPSREEEVSSFLNMLARVQPIDLLIMMLGTNDLLQGNSPEAVAKRMEIFLKQIDLETSRILLIAPPPMVLGEWVPTQALVDASAALHSLYQALSERLGVAFADAGRWNVSVCYDGVHFTEEGHIAFAEGIADLINKGE